MTRIFQLDPATSNALLECEKNSKGHFGTWRCVLRRRRELPFWQALLHEGYHGIYKNARKLFILDLILIFSLIIIGATAVALFVWRPSVVRFIELDIKAAEEIVENGTATKYSITYYNGSEKELTDVELALSPPAGLLIQKALPEEAWNKDRQTFTLPPLDPKKGGEATIEGILIMDPRVKERLTATFSYTQKGRDRRERKAALKEIASRGSIFKAEMSTPPAALKGSPVTVTTTLRHTVPLPLPLVVITPHFAIEKSAPPITENKWTVNTWHPADTQTFVLTAAPPDGREESLPLNFEAAITINGAHVAQPIEGTALPIINPGLSLTFEGSWEDTVEFGAPIPLALRLKNEGKGVVMTGFELTLTPSIPIRLADGGDFTLVENTLIYRSAQALAEGETLALKAVMTVPQVRNETSLSLTPFLTYRLMYEGSALDGTLKGDERAATLIAPPTLYAEARYFNIYGDQLGRGPLPPSANHETKYWVHWTIAGGSRELQNVRVSAPLPSYSRLTGKASVSAGRAPFFDSATHSVVWENEALGGGEVVDIFFEAGVTPSNADVGRPLTLIGKTTLASTDSLTRTPLIPVTALPLTSELYNDEKARGFGGLVTPGP